MKPNPELSERKKGWGRWGVDDERGAANLCVGDVVTQAAKEVTDGRVYSLGLPIKERGMPVAGLRSPSLHLMRVSGSDYLAGTKAEGGAEFADEYLIMNTQGTTHIDGLSHIWCDGELYNGWSSSEVRGTTGARRCGIEKTQYLVSRGVLLDLARFLGVEHLPSGHVISVAELEGCAAAQNVSISAGDIVLIRTGWLNVFWDDPAAFDAGEPGIGIEAGRWLAERDIVAVGADNAAVEVMPWDGHDEGLVSPVHLELIRGRGIYFLELMNLEELASDSRFTFMLVIAPLLIKGGVASPLNPLAIC